MPQPYDRAGQFRVLELLSLLRPLTMRSQIKVRLGNPYDGGYVLPMAAVACDGMISIGVGPDVSFDLALARQGAQIVQFDHTVEKLPAEHPNFRFFRKGWGPESGGDFLSLTDIAAQLGTDRQHRLLKFDIEGGEYDAFTTVSADDLRPFDVICCELHHLDKLTDETFFAKVRHLLETLHRYHAPVHLHGNNYGKFFMLEGIAMPDTIELSYLRRDLDSFDGYSREPIPGPLDRPNQPFLADMCLNPF